MEKKHQISNFGTFQHFLAPRKIEKSQKAIYWREVYKKKFQFRQKKIQNFKAEKNDARKKM